MYWKHSYEHFSLQELSRHFTLRILLCHVDVHDCEKPLLDINKTAVLNDFTFILAWSLQVPEKGKPQSSIPLIESCLDIYFF